MHTHTYKIMYVEGATRRMLLTKIKIVCLEIDFGSNFTKIIMHEVYTLYSDYRLSSLTHDHFDHEN